MASAMAPAFALPAPVVSQGYALRSETEDDVPFLRRLYASTREEELSQVSNWTDEQKRLFLEGQFNAQRHHYRLHIPECQWHVIECRGAPAGRLYLEVTAGRLHIVDIAFMPEHRGKGIGGAILEVLIATARSTGRVACIFVEKFNPALRLYRRLGFTEISDTGVYLEMEWSASNAAAPVN